jgi:arylsulfatase
VLNRPHSITADVEVPDGAVEGVLLAQGSAVGGWSFYVLDGRLRYAHNYLRSAIYRVTSGEPVPAGRHALRFEFEPTGEPDVAHGKGTPGRAQLYIDRRLVAQADVPVTIPVMIVPGSLSCGADPGSPVVPDYRAPFRFTGTLHTVTVDLSGELITDSESEMRVAMARQ